tara:strand:+ start:938 stop:1159 length:222 start_codon:yes stop_codon:yes gene_type:complete
MYIIINTSDITSEMTEGSKRVFESIDKSKSVIMFYENSEIPDALSSYDKLNVNEFHSEIEKDLNFWLGRDNLV